MFLDERHEFVALIRIPGTNLGCRVNDFYRDSIPTAARFRAFLFFSAVFRVCANSHQVEHFGRAQTVIVVCRALNTLELLVATIKPRVQRKNENRINF